MSERRDIEWFTTNPPKGGRSRPYDGPQRGWKLHAVPVTAEEVRRNIAFGEIDDRRALCGLLPSNGWGLDFWIEDRCERCAKAAER